MNLSGSGLSLTQRTKWGSYGTRGFSIRTGIPGLYYRKRYSKKDGDITGIVVLLAALVFALVWALIQAALLVVFIVVRIVLVCLAYVLTGVWEVMKWCALTFWDFSQYCLQRWHTRRLQRQQSAVVDSALAVEIPLDERQHPDSHENPAA